MPYVQALLSRKEHAALHSVAKLRGITIQRLVRDIIVKDLKTTQPEGEQENGEETRKEN